jgi:hypothetical protein
MVFLNRGILPHQRSGRLSHSFGRSRGLGADYNKALPSLSVPILTLIVEMK